MLKHTINAIERLTTTLGMALIGSLVVVMMYEIVMRYFFAAPTIWASELTLWVGGIVYLLGGIVITRQRQHITVPVVRDLMPPKVQHVMGIAATALSMVFPLGAIYGGFNAAKSALLDWDTFGTAWDPPIPAVSKPLILFVMLLIILFLMLELIERIQDKTSDFSDEHDVAQDRTD